MKEVRIVRNSIETVRPPFSLRIYSFNIGAFSVSFADIPYGEEDDLEGEDDEDDLEGGSFHFFFVSFHQIECLKWFSLNSPY